MNELTPTSPKQPQVRCAFTEMRPTAELRRHPKNPNQHPPEQVRLLAKIIEATGFRQSIVISSRSGLITKGHGRLDAAQLNGYASVPVDIQLYATEAEELADLLADNLVADLATVNGKQMQSLLTDLTAAGDDSLKQFLAKTKPVPTPGETLKPLSNTPKKVQGTPEEIEAWCQAQEKSGMNWNNFARSALNTASNFIPPP